MTTWAMIPCSKTKAQVPCVARLMYWPSALFRAAYLTAEYSGQERVILSAKYGAIHPGTWIDPYDVTLNTKPKFERDQWAQDVMKMLGRLFRPGDHVVSYLGAKYAEAVVPALRLSGYTVEEPWKGLTQGGRLKWFAERRDGI